MLVWYQMNEFVLSMRLFVCYQKGVMVLSQKNGSYKRGCISVILV